MYFELDKNNNIVSYANFPINGNSSFLDDEEFPIDLETFYDNFYEYKFENGELVKREDYLQEYISEKEKELSNSCNEAILAGFDHEINGVVYHFSMDTEAQLNFQGAERLLSKGAVPVIEWTVTTENGKYTRIAIDNAEMEKISLAILMHKNSNIAKFRNDLMVKVTNAQTKEEIESIKW